MSNDDRQDAAKGETPEPSCEICGGSTVPIAYGYPGPEMWEAAERGEIELGGCMVFDGQPMRRCTSCGAALSRRRSRFRDA